MSVASVHQLLNKSAFLMTVLSQTIGKISDQNIYSFKIIALVVLDGIER